MPRRVAKTSRSTKSPGAGAVSVVSGSIRTADDPTALDVKISIWDTEVTMRADGSELGHWPTPAVTITPVDAFTFEFVAEGDRLVFTPDNPDEFKQLPIVAGPSKSKRKRGKKANKARPATAELRWDEESQTEMDMRSKRAKGEKEPRPSRQERKAAAREAKQVAADAAASRANHAPVADHDVPESRASKPSRRERNAARKPEPVAQAAVDEFDTMRVEEPKRAPKARRESKPREERKPRRETKLRRERKPKHDANGHSRIADMRHRAWISSLDFAREYDLFGLDRVPIHPEERDDPNHQHTWNHRVAPAGGPGSFICTLCGAFKKRGS